MCVQVMTCAVSSGEDVILKKMLYLYISTYAQSNPDLTLLTINLLTKDCKDQDPTIRGLALRSLCQLRVANLIEYIVSPTLLQHTASYICRYIKCAEQLIPHDSARY
jgi:vesicle coat complex subunit